MTTICWAANTLASDSRMTCNHMITTDKFQKIHKLNRIEYIEDQLLYIALAGNAGDNDMVLHYLHSQDFPSREIEHKCSGIVVGCKFVYVLEPGNGYLIRFSKATMLAEGSGADIAMTAMLLGKTAIEAVKVAMKLDTCSGGKVQSVEFK